MPTCPYTWRIDEVLVALRIRYAIEPYRPATPTGPEEGGTLEVQDVAISSVLTDRPIGLKFFQSLLNEGLPDLESICREHAAEQERNQPRNKWEARCD